MTTRLSEIDTAAETPDVLEEQRPLVAEDVDPEPLVRENAAEAPLMMAPHPDSSFAVLEDEEEAARKGVGTGIGVVAFDKVRKSIKSVNDRGEVVIAELEVPLGLPIGEDAKKEQLARREDERIDEAKFRRGGKAGKGVEDIRREIVEERKRKRVSEQERQEEQRKEELKEELELEASRQDIKKDIDAMVARTRGDDSKQERPKDEVTTQELNEDKHMKVQELFNGTIDDHTELRPVLDEARSLKTLMGENLHQVNEMKRRNQEEPERNRRLYYREKGVDDDGWLGEEKEELEIEQQPRARAGEESLARMVEEEIEAEQYNEEMRQEKKRRLEEAACGGTPAFPVKRRNSLRADLTLQMRRQAQLDKAEKKHEEELALKGQSSDLSRDVSSFKEDIYDHPENDSVYYTYGAEQLDFSDMNKDDMGDYDTLRPFDPDEDLMREEKQEEHTKTDKDEKDGQKAIDDAREDVLVLEGCKYGRRLRPEPPSDDAQPLLRKKERLPANWREDIREKQTKPMAGARS